MTRTKNFGTSETNVRKGKNNVYKLDGVGDYNIKLHGSVRVQMDSSKIPHNLPRISMLREGNSLRLISDSRTTHDLVVQHGSEQMDSVRLETDQGGVHKWCYDDGSSACQGIPMQLVQEDRKWWWCSQMKIPHKFVLVDFKGAVHLDVSSFVEPRFPVPATPSVKLVIMSIQLVQAG